MAVLDGKAITNSLPLHPLLFTAYPVLALLAYNAEEIGGAAALRSLLVSLAAAAALVILLGLWLRNGMKAALVATLTLGLFFSYGHVYNFLEPASLSGLSLGRHRLLLPLWSAFFCLGCWWATRPTRALRQLTRSLNVIAAVALVFPLGQYGLFGLRTLQASSQGSTGQAAAGLRLPESEPAPDIYYIILDGYGRDDILEKFYGLDNRPFLEQLAHMGFYVARCSQSNFAQTQLSLASSLNWDYLEALGDGYQPGSTSRAGLPGLIQHSAARQALEGLGYRTIAFETGFEASQMEDADLYLASRAERGLNDFESLFIRTTAGRVLAEGIAFLNLRPDWEARDRAHRQRILFALEKLRSMPAEPGPKFVFAHLVAPHWPHVFGPDGEPVHERPDSVSGYRNQVIFLNRQLETILAEILSNSATPPVIILQGDHGPVVESPQRRMSILNAYHLPGEAGSLLYEAISPVNTFRLILNAYFGGELPLLEDVAYYSRYEEPFDFQVVPEGRAGCAVP